MIINKYILDIYIYLIHGKYDNQHSYNSSLCTVILTFTNENNFNVR